MNVLLLVLLASEASSTKVYEDNGKESKSTFAMKENREKQRE